MYQSHGCILWERYNFIPVPITNTGWGPQRLGRRSLGKDGESFRLGQENLVWVPKVLWSRRGHVCVWGISILWAPKTCSFRGFLRQMTWFFRWPKPLIFMIWGAHGNRNSHNPSPLKFEKGIFFFVEHLQVGDCCWTDILAWRHHSIKSRRRRKFNGFLGGGLKYFLCSPLLGEMIQFHWYCSDGLKPPTSFLVEMFVILHSIGEIDRIQSDKWKCIFHFFSGGNCYGRIIV